MLSISVTVFLPNTFTSLECSLRVYHTAALCKWVVLHLEARS